MIKTILDWLQYYVPLPSSAAPELVFLQYLFAYGLAFLAVIVALSLCIGIVQAIFSPRRMR